MELKLQDIYYANVEWISIVKKEFNFAVFYRLERKFGFEKENEVLDKLRIYDSKMSPKILQQEFIHHSCTQFNRMQTAIINKRY
jgi:hypothetical protein